MTSSGHAPRWSVRPAEVDDADAMGGVHVRAWQAAYRGVMPQAFLDGLDPAARADYWRAALAGPPLPGERLVLLAGEEVVGLAGCGPVREDPPEGPVREDSPDVVGLGELYAINLDPQWWGTGGGTVLLDACVDHLRAAGHREAVLWVAAANERARAFYAARGWAPDGAAKADTFGGAVVDEVRYRRSLTD